MKLTFHPGQSRAWKSEKRIVAIIAGHQSGKSVLGPHWMKREMERRGPGDYLVVGPTNPLLKKKVLPEFLKLFETQLALGEYRASDKIFYVSRAGQVRLHGAASDTPTKVFFGHATDPESVESATAKAAWEDEAGQSKFKHEAHEAIQRRLSIHQGRTLITTTPYNLKWLKTEVYDPWVKSGKNHPDIGVINFDSLMNPAFPREEYESKRRTLPAWKFNLFYKGIFERPAGAIFDRFNNCAPPAGHVVPRFRIPAEWPRYLGLDFGATNTAGVFLAAELGPNRLPTGRYYAYREYHPGKLPPQTHVHDLLEGEPGHPLAIGGSPQEDDWRDRFSHAGMGVCEPPVRDVEVGIDSIYEMTVNHVNGWPELVFMDHLTGTLGQMENYSREMDEMGEPTEVIEDKQLFHFIDALRYICVWLKRGGLAGWSATTSEDRGAIATAPDGVFHKAYEPPENKDGIITGGDGAWYDDRFPKW